MLYLVQVFCFFELFLKGLKDTENMGTKGHMGHSKTQKKMGHSRRDTEEHGKYKNISRGHRRIQGT